MESFTIELVSNASAQTFPGDTLSSFTNFLQDQLNLQGHCKVAVSGISYPSMYQNVTEENFMFFDKKTLKFVGTLLPGTWPLSFLYGYCLSHEHSLARKTQSKRICITVEVTRETQKVETYLANEGSGLAFFSTDLGLFFGCNVGNEFVVMLRRKGPRKPEFAHDKVGIHSLMIYTDLIEYNVVGNTKAPLLHCFLFISKLKAGDIITSGHYMNYQTFSNLHFRPPVKNSFHGIHIDLRDTSGENILIVSVGIIRLVLMCRKASNIIFWPKSRYKMVAPRQVDIPFYRGIGRQRGRGFGALAQAIGRTRIPFLRKYIVPAAKRLGADLLEFAVGRQTLRN